MKYRLTIVSLIVLSVCAACSSGSDNGMVDLDQPPESLPAEAAPVAPEAETMPSLSDVGVRGLATGELTEVDVDRQTFGLLADDGSEYTFHYSASTEGARGEGAQGLATREGSRISVTYDATSDPPEALSIDVIDISPF